MRYKEYFGAEGGLTLSGGEPLLQAAFAAELFALAHEAGIHTCLDTSGCLWNEDVRGLLRVCDRVLLDIKYTTEAQYKEHVGCPLSAPLAFLGCLDEMKIPTTLRQVILPTLNDTKESVRALRTIAEAHPCVDKVELLPFRKLCTVKYDRLGIPFPFAHIPEPTAEKMAELEALLK